MDFIFMLTHQDRTIEDCLAVVDLVAPVGLRHVGFKDVGVDTQTLARLNERIHAKGMTSYMEVVSTTPEACLRSARVARDIGVDRLLGGTLVEETRMILHGSPVEYYPFPGLPAGHPTQLGGSPEDVERDCRGFVAQGCAGADLLAYRATDADPLDLVRAARRGLGNAYLIVAGNVDNRERIRNIARAGANAFTIGSAIFAGSYSPRKGSILSQLADVLDDCTRTSLDAAA